MKIMVTGKGGREHALLTALRDSETQPELFACPGSDAISELASCVPAETPEALVDWMKVEGIDLCVAGEESWLGKGLADLCREAGIRVWGPVQEAARLETSKRAAKEFMKKHQVPTGDFTVVSTPTELDEAIPRLPTVLKYDGLAAGKGVTVCFNQLQVEEYRRRVLEERVFGDGDVVVEQFLDGNELSVICAVMDDQVLLFTPARDYKRQLDGDHGPNTGGMGAVASRAMLDRAWMEQIQNEVILPTVRGLVDEGLSYRGFLYFGLMLTRNGPRVVEYNCRFGDPEAQAILPLVSGDLAAFLYRAADGDWDPSLITFQEEAWCVTVVLATRDYPAASGAGDRIEGLPEAEAHVYHAGTRKTDDDGFETNGGRVLAVSACGEDLDAARTAAYRELSGIRFDGMQHRDDIGALHFEGDRLAAPEADV